MDFDTVRARLVPLPTDRPPPPAALEPKLVLRPGSAGVPPLPTGPAHRGAALVLLYPGSNRQAFVVLTERPRGEMRHSGEVSLPGGAVEETDESDAAAALREASEEIGLDGAQAGVEVIGELQPVDVRVSGFRLVPVLAVAARRPAFSPNAREVASVVEAPVAAFLPGAPIEIVEEERAGVRLRYGAFPVRGYRVWGATARILGQLGALLDAS